MRTLKLGDVCSKIGSGATPRGGSDVYLAEGVPLIRSQNVYNDGFHSDGLAFIGEKHANELSGVTVQPGDVLLNITGDSVARACRAPAEMTPARVNQHVAIIRPDESILNSCYLHYYLVSPDKQASMLSLASGGATRNALTKAMIENFEVPAPPIEDQVAIAEVLGSLDDKIEQNHRTGAKLEGLTRAVFKAWFVDFEPVKAKAAGAMSFPGMRQETFAALPSQYIDSTLGPLPQEWEVKSIGEVVTVRGGGTPSTTNDSFWTNGCHFWATPKDLSSLLHPILLSTERRITDAGVATISSGVLPVDTVLLSSRAPIGYLALTKVPTAVNQGFIAIQCNGRLKPHFMLQWLDERMDEIKSRASGTTFAEISKSAFRPIPAVVPPPAVMSAFEDFAKPMFDTITHCVAESSRLAAIRDYLLPRLLSGRVRVGMANA